MRVGIIGYGSMGKMLVEKLLTAKGVSGDDIYVANRTQEKIAHLDGVCHVCKSNREVAENSDITFMCVCPLDIKSVLTEIKDVLREESLLVSLNGSVLFEQLQSVCQNKIAKVIPSVTAEVNKSQTLVCYNEMVGDAEKRMLESLLKTFGTVIELPEEELGMGSELVSCMPGFIAALFNEICLAGKKHTKIPENEVVQMVLRTMVGTGELMLANGYFFEEVVSRVATKGGITEVGTRIIHEQFPDIAEELFEKTLEKRRETTEKAQKGFA